MPRAQKKMSRGELNKKARQVFAKNGVDLTLMQFRASPNTLIVYGILQKQDGSGFTFEAVQQMTFELSEYFRSIRSELQNWNLDAGSVKKIKTAEDKRKEKEMAVRSQSAIPQSDSKNKAS